MIGPSAARTRPATTPPPGLPGLEPSWSRLVDITDADGRRRTFHVLDSGDVPTIGTLLCVHGNPTWSYLWRGLVASPPPGWRVIAPDHLGMGWSERLDRPRTLAERVDDLGRLTEALDLTGPVVTVAHDWGGILSLGWALQHQEQLRGVVLTNTAVHQPESSKGPLLIRLAHRRWINELAVRRTALFVRTTTALGRPKTPAAVRDAYALPYRTTGDRAAVAEFVADIPFAAEHPSRPALDAIADNLGDLTVPTLLLWGPRDPVFGEAHLRDLQERLPHAVLHRYATANHLLPEDAPGHVAAITLWLQQSGVGSADSPFEASDVDTGTVETVFSQTAVSQTTVSETAASAASSTAADPRTQLETSTSASHVEGIQEVARITDRPDVLDRLRERAQDGAVSVAETAGTAISWAELHERVERVAAGLTASGVRPGDRVALLIPPSIDLTVALYAVWRAGAVIVVADKGLGLRGMGRALRSARLDHLIADTAGLLVAGPMRLPGTRFAVRPPSPAVRRLARVRGSLAEFAGDPAPAAGVTAPVVGDPTSAAGVRVLDDEAEAAVLFTSGATGPAKGVRYRHRQVRAQLALIRGTYGLTRDDRIVAAFAPFALYGPALGITSAVPDTDVTKPGTLTAAALGDAADRIDGTVVFASPAALRNVLATAGGLDDRQKAALGRVRLLISAGAPVPAVLLQELQQILPAATMHTPYGMTEALPATDISLAEILEAGDGDGVCVGRPLAGVEIRVAPLDPRALPADVLSDEPGVTGELWIRADHVKDSYDALWLTDQLAAAHPGWHRTGDVGAMDAQGRWWIQGRLVHVVSTADGPVTPVGVEQAAQRALAAHPDFAATSAAAVGVGPAGTQQVVVVLAGPGGPVASAEVAALVRGAVPTPIAAVLVRSALPVDIRHNSKIDRVAVADWATTVLTGR